MMQVAGNQMFQNAPWSNIIEHVYLLGGAPEFALVQPPEGPGRALGVSLKPIRGQYCGEVTNQRPVLWPGSQ